MEGPDGVAVFAGGGSWPLAARQHGNCGGCESQRSNCSFCSETSPEGGVGSGLVLIFNFHSENCLFANSFCGLRSISIRRIVVRLFSLRPHKQQREMQSEWPTVFAFNGASVA